jgi:putative membrane protein
MYNNWAWSSMMGGFGFGWIFMILFWILIIWVIIALIRGSKYNNGCGGHDHSGHKDNRDKKSTALDILNERYAKSEIEKKEYEEKKKYLTS